MRFVIYSAWIIFFLAVGCNRGGQNDQSTSTQQPPDAWYRLPTDDFILSAEKKERDPATFARVVDAKLSESISRLENTPCIEVTEQEATELAGRPIGGTGGRLFLLRALCWDTPHGGFTVSWKPNAVWVSHGTLGRHPIPVLRKAVVARLPDKPTDVFVDLQMAE